MVCICRLDQPRPEKPRYRALKPSNPDARLTMLKPLFLLTTLTVSSQAFADDREKWEGVYERADKRVEVGEWMGIGGGAAVGAGFLMFTSGLAQSGVSFNEGNFGDAGGGFLFATSGVSVAGTGFAAFALGPTLTASGSIRQAKAVRKLNPDAPRAWYGTAAWFFWLSGFGTSNVFAATVPISTAYVLSALQQKKNRKHWNGHAKAELERMERSNFSLAMAPMSTTESRGLMLYGTF